MTEPTILAFFAHRGIQISAGAISNLLINDHTVFHAEQDAVYDAGLRSRPWQQIDDTSTRGTGQHAPCHVVHHPLPTTSLTVPAQDRLRGLDGLRTGRVRGFRFTSAAEAWLAAAGVSAATRQKRSALPRDVELDAAPLSELVERGAPGVGKQPRTWVLDALAVAASQAPLEWPVRAGLVGDGALQCPWITNEVAGGWVHEGRQSKKVQPTLALHQAQLAPFRKECWAFYDELLASRQPPRTEARERRSASCEGLVGTSTGDWALDERSALTRAKQAGLLLGLEHPELPRPTTASA